MQNVNMVGNGKRNSRLNPTATATAEVPSKIAQKAGDQPLFMMRGRQMKVRRRGPHAALGTGV